MLSALYFIQDADWERSQANMDKASESEWCQHRVSQKETFIYAKTNELWCHWRATALEKSEVISDTLVSEAQGALKGINDDLNTGNKETFQSITGAPAVWGDKQRQKDGGRRREEKISYIWIRRNMSLEYEIEKLSWKLIRTLWTQRQKLSFETWTPRILSIISGVGTEVVFLGNCIYHNWEIEELASLWIVNHFIFLPEVSDQWSVVFWHGNVLFYTK